LYTAYSLCGNAPTDRRDLSGGTHVLALDGLRFLAAFCVLAGHGYWFVVLAQQPNAVATPFDRFLVWLPALGMTLFFTLSGFVIHLNYGEKVGIKTGVGSFIVARFARLYPLFLVVFAIDFVRLLWEDGYFDGRLYRARDLFSALPLYLTFTQTWWLWPIGPTSAYEFYGTPTTGRRNDDGCRQQTFSVQAAEQWREHRIRRVEERLGRQGPSRRSRDPKAGVKLRARAILSWKPVARTTASITAY